MSVIWEWTQLLELKSITLNFPARGSTVTVNLRSGKDNLTDYFNILIESTSSPMATMTATLANPLISSYFNNFSKITTCQEKQFISCENFQTIPDGKRGYAVQIIGEPPRSIGILSACFIPKESKSFTEAKSCIVF